MKLSLYFSILVGFWLSCFQAVNASVIDENGPNPMIVGKAFGFMLFGNDGFMTPGIENLAVDGCKVSYETDGGLYSHCNTKDFVSYDLNKANWRSAVYQPDYYNDIVWFEIYGETGLREVRYDHTFENENDLRIGVGFLGLSVNISSKRYQNSATKLHDKRTIRPCLPGLDSTMHREIPADETNIPTRLIRRKY